jgi:hypothetical protein
MWIRRELGGHDSRAGRAADGQEGKSMSGLFENQREANLSSAVLLIEEVLVELGYRLDSARTSIPATTRAWRVPKGSAVVDIALVDRPDSYHLRVAASVMTIGEKTDREALFERLLSFNASQLVGDAFALRGDQVILIGQRSTKDLDRSEVQELIQNILIDADHYDDRLITEFGGKRG